jgi:hypothetical protein
MSLCVPSISLRTEAGDPTENGCLIRGGVFVWRGFRAMGHAKGRSDVRPLTSHAQIDESDHWVASGVTAPTPTTGHRGGRPEAVLLC